MPAVEMKPGKYIIIKKDTDGRYFIRVNEDRGKFEIPITDSTRGERKYLPTEGTTGNGWVLPLIERPNGNGHVPIEEDQ